MTLAPVILSALTVFSGVNFTLPERPAQPYSIAVFGDSTSDQTTEWPYLLGRSLGRYRWPAKAISYQHYNRYAHGWSGETSIQSGVDAPLRILNASCGGWSAATFSQEIRERGLSHLLSETPDLILVSLGHNSIGIGTAYKVQLQAFLDLLPNVPIVLVTQNPQRPDWQVGEATNQRRRMESVRELVRERGYGLIDPGDVFTSRTLNGDWSWLNPGEYVHPNGEGERLWASIVLSQLSPMALPADSMHFGDRSRAPW
ncbi:MAG: SGNH/GDSL hydrolase family protein [Bacteroidales bacterium]|nr:SGNH/GDSL hydrolase family protein [Bacteroidales bacterium]